MEPRIIFAVLLLLNVYFFGFFACFELVVIFIKATSMPKEKYETTVVINEIFIFAFMVTVESTRLLMGKKHDQV